MGQSSAENARSIESINLICGMQEHDERSRRDFLEYRLGMDYLLVAHDQLR
jgi:hypothetical protein